MLERFFKKEERPEMIYISGRQLYELIKAALLVIKKQWNEGKNITGIEIMFEYMGNIHFVDIRYDRKTAREKKKEKFSMDFVSILLDGKSYHSPEALYERGSIGKVPVKNIKDGIEVFTKFCT